MGISRRPRARPTSARPTPTCQAATWCKSPTLLNIPLAVSAQTVIYNLPGLSQDSHVNLDGKVLAEIYRGTITMLG